MFELRMRTTGALAVGAVLIAGHLPAASQVAVLDAEASAGAALVSALKRAGFEVVRQDAADAVAVADASGADVAVVSAALGWIRQGRPALVLGAPLAAPRRPTAPTVEVPLPKVERWEFGHGERGAATGTLTETNGLVHITFSPMLDWSVFTSSKVRVFASGADILCFEARAAEPSTDLQIELKDVRGGRWFRTIRMGTAWTRFALYPEDFTGYVPLAHPDFAEVDCIAFALSHHTPRMAGRPADFELRGLGSARDPAPERRACPPFQDALYPHWKLADAGAFMTPVPRASGQGAFRGLRWRLIGTGEAEWTFLERPVDGPARAFVASGWKDPGRQADAASLDRMAGRLKRLVERPTLFAAGSRQFAYRPGEIVRLGAEWRGGSLDAAIEQTVADPDGRVVWRGGTTARADGTNAWETAWTAPGRAGVYRVRTVCGDDVIEQALTVMADACDPKESFVTVSNGVFRAYGRIWHPIGVNYVPRYCGGLNPADYRDAWLNDDYYDPAIVDEDLAHVAEMGATFVAIQAPSLGSSRNLVDFLRLARKHRLRVNLFVWELDPLDFREAGWRRRARDIGLKNDSTVFAYDIAWEFGFKVFEEGNRRGARAKDWADWIDEEYGNLSAAEEDWGCAVDRDRQGCPVGPVQRQLTEDGPWRRKIAAYRRFMDDFTSRKWNRARRLIREEDPNHLVSYRQGNTVPHDFTFTGPVRHLDFIAPEGYMVTDTRHGEDVIAWVTRFASATSGGKPVVWMEFSRDSWDRVTESTLPEELQKAADYAARFYRAGLASGAAGMTPWWWPGGFRFAECSDYGMVEPTGAERPLAKTFRRFVAPYAAVDKPFEPDTWMDFDRDVHAGGYWRAALYEGAVAWRKASDAGRRLGIRLAGEGTDSVTCEKRFLRGEFDRLDVTREGAEIRVKAELGNTGMAVWLPAAAGKGGVSLAVRSSDGRLLAHLPLTRSVARFDATGPLETAFAIPRDSADKLTFRLEAAGRFAFGERRIACPRMKVGLER